jgi:hypothetical protein
MAGLPAWMRPNQRIIRMPVNEMDKCTIVSVFPRDIVEVKHTLSPGKFEIPAAKKDDFELVVVGPSSWWKETDPHQPLLEIQTSSVRIAESVIIDYCNGLIGCDMHSKMPGLFFVQGVLTKKNCNSYIQPNTNKTFGILLEEARRKQKEYFLELVKIADLLWVRSSGNPMVIGSDMKMAAKELGMLDKPWIGESKRIDMAPCKACGEFVNPTFPVCKHCKAIINREEAERLGLKFAS